jgi:hypothetical protein
MNERGTDGGSGGTSESLALAAFDDPEPLTVTEVVEATGLDRDSAERALDRLTSAGRLGTRTVGDVRVWYATPGGGNGAETTDDADRDRPVPEDDPARADWSPEEVTVRGTGGSTEGTTGFDERQVETAVADLDVPGTSEMMRDWRRSAVRAAFEYLRDVGEAGSGDIVEAVYSAHRAGYGDADSWWAFVAPRLASLPGVERENEHWAFAGENR